MAILESSDSEYYIVVRGKKTLLTCALNDNDLSNLIVNDIMKYYDNKMVNSKGPSFKLFDKFKMELLIEWRKTSDGKILIRYDGLYVCDDDETSFKKKITTLIDKHLFKRLLMTKEELDKDNFMSQSDAAADILDIL